MPTTPRTLVLIRHGQSRWNLENRFTGWTDVDLSPAGVEEARAAGRLLREKGFVFDVAHTSLLQRAIKTLHHVLDEMNLLWIPVEKSWRLNERHYGALQGLDKAETAAQHGEEKTKLWRRSYDIPPPPLALDDPRHPRNDARYASLGADELPLTECLKDTVARFLPYWHERIAAELRAGKRVVIAAHGNSLRALVKYLDGISDEAIVGVNIPTGMPLEYQLDENLRPVRSGYLGDPDAAKRAAEAVAKQGKKKT